jgi:hypothetical protein
MRGAGPEFFSVWGYIISHMIPNRSHGTTVELNPGIIAFLIGMKESVVEDKIKQMCEPDLKSRTRDEDGKKLVKLSVYVYRVVNGDYYRKIRNEQERREYQRIKQSEYRKKKIQKSMPVKGEKEYVDAMTNGASETELQAIIDKHLPQAA